MKRRPFAATAALAFLAAGIAGCIMGTKSIRLAPDALPDAQLAAIWIPIQLDPLQFDGTSMWSVPGSTFADRYKLIVAPGRHELTVRYSALADGNPDQQEMLRSRPVTLVLDPAPGRHYLLSSKLPDGPKREDRDLAGLQIFIEDITSQFELLRQWDRQPRRTDKISPLRETPKPAQTTDTTTADPTSVVTPKPTATPAPVTAGALPVEKPAPTSTAPATPAPVTTATPDRAASNAETLKSLWHNASEAERGEFMQWTVTNRPAGSK